MKAQYNVGTTWDLEQLEGIKSLNEQSTTGIVTEVYGSIPKFRTARSRDRLPPISYKGATGYISKAHSYNIDFKWTLNFSCIGATIDFVHEWAEMERQLVPWLSDLGVHKYIVTIPLVIELLKTADPKSHIEVSTIAHISSLREVQDFVSLGADNICWDVMRNRDLDLLESAITYCSEHNVEVELIVNEMCTFMCIHRSICYNLSSHSSGRSPFGGYPFSRCIAERFNEPWKWLSTRFVLPSDIPVYQSMGVSRFKITGRTHTTETVLRILGYYMSRADPENLLDLWPHVNALVSDKADPSKDIFISTKYLREKNLVRQQANARHKCFTTECGATCRFCEMLYENACKRE